MTGEQQSGMKYEIDGAWEPADQSSNRLEVAKTNEENILAIRDSFSPSSVVFATQRQVLGLAEAVNSGRMRRLGLRG